MINPVIRQEKSVICEDARFSFMIIQTRFFFSYTLHEIYEGIEFSFVCSFVLFLNIIYIISFSNIIACREPLYFLFDF